MIGGVMRQLRIIAADFAGLCAVCGPVVGFRWLAAVVLRLGACRRAGNLQPADAMLGDGPISVRLGNARARLVCYRVLTGVRETWVRDSYLGHGFLSIPRNARVIDLGSNMGNFTALALGHGPDVRVLAVDADPTECRRLQQTLAVNGWTDRVDAVNAFVGGRSRYQEELLASGQCATVGNISADDLIRRAGGSVDFIKCDIEGSEFALFAAGSPLFAATNQIAMELHPHAGNPLALIALLEANGFEVRRKDQGPTITVLARRKFQSR
jgi:FkbM family methyltransferase